MLISTAPFLSYFQCKEMTTLTAERRLKGLHWYYGVELASKKLYHQYALIKSFQSFM